VGSLSPDTSLLGDRHVLGRKVDLRDDSETFGPSFTEQYCCAFLEEFWPVHESESYRALVLQPHVLFVHRDNFGCLSDDTAVDYCLVVWLDGRGVVQDDDLCFEIVDRLRFGVLVDEDHSFPEVVPLEGLLLHLGLDGKADGLTS